MNTVTLDALPESGVQDPNGIHETPASGLEETASGYQETDIELQLPDPSVDADVAHEPDTELQMLAADAEQASSAVEEPPEEEEDEDPQDSAPAESVDAAAAPVADAAELRSLIEQLNAIKAQLTSRTGSAGKATPDSGRSGPGSKPRATTIYRLLKRPVVFEKTPQVKALQHILFDNREGPAGEFRAEFSEPEIFELIEKGHKAGVLQTNQSPVRIFQYYRNTLRKLDQLQFS